MSTLYTKEDLNYSLGKIGLRITSTEPQGN